MSNDRDDEGDVTMELSMSDVMNFARNDNRDDDPFAPKTLKLDSVAVSEVEDTAEDPEVTITHERPAHVETTTEIPIATRESALEQAAIMSESTVEFDPSAYIAQARRPAEEPARADVHDAVTSVISANEVLFAAEQWEGAAESSHVSEVEHTSTYDASDIAALMQHHDNEHVPLQLDERTQDRVSARAQLTKGQMSFVVQVDEEGKITLPETLRAAMVPGERVRISIIFLED